MSGKRGKTNCHMLLGHDLIKPPTHKGEPVPDPPKAPANMLSKRCTLPATTEKWKLDCLDVEDFIDTP